MFKNYFKIAFRNLLKQRVHSGINLMGLAIGLASVTLIALWIQRELSMNNFHENGARIFRIMEHQTYGEDIYTFGATPGPLAKVLVEDYPEISHACRSTWDGSILVTVGELSAYEKGKGVEPSFLEMFTFPLLYGDKNTALTKPDDIIITKDMAEKYFGKTNAVGEHLMLHNNTEYVVAGILENLPKNSQMKFSMLYPFEVILKNNESLKQWGNNSIITYFMTNEPMTSEYISAKIDSTIINHSEVEGTELHAHPLADWYLRSDFENGKQTGGGRIEHVRLFGIIALFILIIACINFMNLSTAKSANRAMEVGVRKVSGAGRSTLAAQFIMESMFTVVLAGLLGAAMASMILPKFNLLFNLELSMGDAGMPFYLGMAGVILLTGFLAGSYPAFFLSGFDPVRVLKGQIQSGKGAVRLRKVLVTAQFIISISLIICSLVVFNQIEYIKNKNLGYDKENLMYFSFNGNYWDDYDALKTELTQLPDVGSVSFTSAQIHYWGNNTSSVDWDGKDPETSILFQTVPVGYDFLKTIGAELKEGRDFSVDFPADSTNFVINETAAKLMGLESPVVGKTISLWDTRGRIVGLAKDFHVGSFKDKQDPVVLFMGKWKNNVYVRIRPSADMGALLSNMETVFKKHSPGFPFNYHFTDVEYAALHQAEIITGKLAKVFAFLAIFVSCLGLFGLAIFATEQRRKEIGIRKVLGATTVSLTALVSKDFLILVFIALLFAIPLAYWAMDGWLQDFAYRIDLNWWFFASAGGLAVVVAFLTVATQSVKAALANPVESLHSE